MEFHAQYDVIVIGSGPAGLSAAITCVQNDLSVLLISNIINSNKIRPAESVHPGILTILTSLKAESSIRQSTIGKYQGIRTSNIVTNLGSDENGIWFGYHINRTIFDETLLQSAIQQNVNTLDNVVSELVIDDNCVIGVITNSGSQILSKYVIDATGFKRFGGKKMKFRELFISPPLISWTGISTAIEAENLMFKEANTNFIPNRNGWTWIAPTPPNDCTWTVLSTKGKQFFLKPNILKNYPLKGNIRKSNMRWRLFRPLCKEGIILCGDAAGIIDPAAGQGILNALYSGIKAANTIISCLTNSDNESFYLAEYDNWFYSLFIEKTNKLKSYYIEHGIEIF